MTSRTSRFLYLLPLLLVWAAPARGADQAYLRFVDDGAGGGQLQAAVVTLKNPAGVTVRLVAAVHIADRAYYQQLNQLFRQEDVVLYEMVKPKGMAPPGPGESTGSGVSMIQRFLKDALRLDFQLDDIDYSAPNFVHADLDAETFFRLQKQRGESMLSLMLDMMLKNLSKQPDPNAPEPTLADLIAIFTDPDGARQAKLMLARQFSDIDSVVAGLNGTVLLTERNKAAVAGLKQALGQGKRNIAIFFGAAHMPGIEERLEQDLNFKQVGVTWVKAWDLTAPAPATRPTTAPSLLPD